VIVGVFLLLVIAGSVNAQSKDSKTQAQDLALIGHNELHWARLSEAQAHCDSALKLDPSNEVAKDCLNRVAGMLIDQDLNNADALLLRGKKSDAITLASKWVHGAPQTEQQDRASKILGVARFPNLHDFFILITPEWLRQILVTIVILTGLTLLLLATRKFWREWQRGKWYGNLSKTNWSMLPLKELPAAADMQTGVPTDAVLDALARLGHELERELWQPKLLLLRPTPPANYEPAIISDFLSDSLDYIMLAPGTRDLCLEWKLHDIQLDQAVQSLQLKTTAGMDVGSVARFIRTIFDWFNFGAPTISGIAQTGTDKAVSVHLAARGGRIKSIAVIASTDFAPGIDPLQLSAERAAFKFLLRMRYPGDCPLIRRK